MEKIKKFQKKQFLSWQNIVLTVILIGSAFLMFYKVNMTAIVGFDQGNHLNPVADSIRNKNILYQGPAALEKGGYKAYLGPFYYYLLAIPLLLTNLNALSASYFSGILALISVVYSYYLVRKIFDSSIKGIIVAFLLAFTYKFTAMGRGFTNPFYLLPFLLMLMDSVWTISQNKKAHWGWWAFFGFSLSATLQIHSSCFLLILPIFIYLFWKKSYRQGVKNWLIALVIFLALYSPYIYYQATHNLADIRQYYGALVKAEDPNAVNNLGLVTSIERVITSLDVSMQSFIRWGNGERKLSITIGWVVALVATIIFACFGRKKLKDWYLFSALWVFFFLISAGLFRFPLWDYYFIAIYPMLFIALADILGYLISKTKIWGTIILIIVGGYYIYSNSQPIFNEIYQGEIRATHNPVQPSDLLYIDLRNLANYIVDDAQGQPVQINVCYKFFYPGCFSYQPAYDFLFKWNEKLDWRESADIIYFIRNPKDVGNCQPNDPNLKLISSQDMVSVGVDKYERIK
ncbi:MAG: hypothetical protein UR93_C0005G0027 [Berkelbacteria bacterium GW2011_GWA2_35_9]|uniref:Glycosyltransferase RgtA/B/C/D-like domain-containing protein n=1 Tax=Berkelbacteria bacterium GW2011_GWA2_35_9 TaxID=1618333 RepID=A0A0G0DJK6_9BACT|nr:MAG: hypothetical protein UR93_C0005G0027 [Berkelbacteria bacterium GW2011_GWA2_35_9]